MGLCCVEANCPAYCIYCIFYTILQQGYIIMLSRSVIYYVLLFILYVYGKNKVEGNKALHYSTKFWAGKINSPWSGGFGSQAAQSCTVKKGDQHMV